jgi:hypothetical protein
MFAVCLAVLQVPIMCEDAVRGEPSVTVEDVARHIGGAERHDLPVD